MSEKMKEWTEVLLPYDSTMVPQPSPNVSRVDVSSNQTTGTGKCLAQVASIQMGSKNRSFSKVQSSSPRNDDTTSSVHSAFHVEYSG